METSPRSTVKDFQIILSYGRITADRILLLSLQHYSQRESHRQWGDKTKTIPHLGKKSWKNYSPNRVKQHRRHQGFYCTQPKFPLKISHILQTKQKHSINVLSSIKANTLFFKPIRDEEEPTYFRALDVKLPKLSVCCSIVLVRRIEQASHLQFGKTHRFGK